MFNQLQAGFPNRQKITLSSSLILHFLLLAWLLHSPTPIFVAPTSVARGEEGGGITRIYFGGHSGVTQEHTDSRLTLPRSTKTAKSHRLEQLAAKLQIGNQLAASALPNERPLGSAYGSLSYGTFTGPEIRPALPVVHPDPIFDADLARSVQGDVIIEVTIDSQGNIIQTVVIQSMGPAIDQPVLAALQNWHFVPASRDGAPIPSKQDVYYHFPR